MSYRIALLPGDGIGSEVIGAARTVLEAAGLDALYQELPIGWQCFQAHGSALPAETLAAVRASDAALLGAVGSPLHSVAGYRSPVVALRRELELFACVRPVRTPALPGARMGVDMVVLRENSEGLYAGREHRDGDTAIAERVITRRASARIARWALEYAQQHGRRRITVVHKANVLRETCGLFREAALQALAGAGDIVIDELLVDTAAYHMVRDPERFDILLTTNMFGDILSDAASAWGGGLGLAASANLGTHGAVFEPVHGSAPDIAGRNIANPLAAIGAAALMLEYLGEQQLARQLQRAVEATLRAGIRTPDLGGSASTEQVTAHVIYALQQQASMPAGLVHEEIDHEHAMS